MTDEDAFASARLDAGAILAEELAARWLSPALFAEQARLDTSLVGAILADEVPISREVAEAIGHALSASVEVWTGLAHG